MFKKNMKLFIGFIIGGLIFGSIGVYATTQYLAKDIKFVPSNSEWNVDNVEDALNSLYNKNENIDLMAIYEHLSASNTRERVLFQKVNTTNQSIKIRITGSVLTNTHSNEGIINFFTGDDNIFQLNLLTNSSVNFDKEIIIDPNSSFTMKTDWVNYHTDCFFTLTAAMVVY